LANHVWAGLTLQKRVSGEKNKQPGRSVWPVLKIGWNRLIYGIVKRYSVNNATGLNMPELPYLQGMIAGGKCESGIRMALFQPGASPLFGEWGS